MRALYGLKSSAYAWRAELTNVLANTLKFKSSLADPDVWFKPKMKPDGSTYYAYIFVYVDDILILDVNPREHMTMLEDNYPVKKGSIEEPKTYLGSDIGKMYYPDGTMAWTMGSNAYVKEAINNVKKRLQLDNLMFDKKLSDPNISVKQPFSSLSYRPELDSSALCDDQQAQYFQNLIGVLRWIIELGRIDIAFEVSILSRYLANPLTGHLQQAIHIFKYLDIHRDNVIALDPAYLESPNPNEYNIEQRLEDMKALYSDADEPLPSNAPEPRGKPVQINCFVDADHAGDLKTRRSQTGIIIYCNLAPIGTQNARQQLKVPHLDLSL